MIIELLAFLFGASLVIYFSPKVVKASSSLAKALEIDALIIGLLVVGIGTSVPEISNSVISSLTGHGDINAGDSIGSSITQISLVWGLSILIYKKIKGEREKILFLGGSATLASILAISMLQKGFLSRIDGFLLIMSYLILIYFIRVAIKREYFKVELVEDAVYKTRLKEYAWQTAYSLAGIVVGSVIAVFMIIEISRMAGIAEFTLSFAFMGLTTSFPELIICLAALKDKEYGIAVGDIFGSNIADVTLSMGVGAALAPNIFSGTAPIWSGFYLVLITGLITLIFARKERMERKESVLLIIFYLLAYPLLLI